jgi:hypothetical protein
MNACRQANWHETDAQSGDDQVTVEPFTKVPNWILLADISGQAKAVYALIVMHRNEKRGDNRSWPTMTTLAEHFGVARRQTLTPYVKELKKIGAIRTEWERYGNGRRQIFINQERPPEGYEGARSAKEYYDLRRRGGGSDGTAHGGSHAPAHRGSDAAPDRNKTKVTRRSQQDEEDSESKLSGPASADRGRAERESAWTEYLANDDEQQPVRDNAYYRLDAVLSLDDYEGSTVDGMLMTGSHPKAIVNKVLRDRADERDARRQTGGVVNAENDARQVPADVLDALFGQTAGRRTADLALDPVVMDAEVVTIDAAECPADDTPAVPGEVLNVGDAAEPGNVEQSTPARRGPCPSRCSSGYVFTGSTVTYCRHCRPREAASTASLGPAA